MAHEVMSTLLVAAHNAIHFHASSLQFLPSAKALLQAQLVTLAFGCAVYLLRFRIGCAHWKTMCNGERNFFRVVLMETRDGSPQRGAQRGDYQSGHWKTICRDCTKFSMVVMMIMETLVAMEVTVTKSVVRIAVSKRLPKACLRAFMVALEISACAMAFLCLLESHALLEDWLRALVVTLTVLALAMALHGLLHFCFHVWTAWLWAALVASMIMATGPMACHDGNALLTSLVESDPEWLWALLYASCVTSALLLTNVEL